MKIIRKETLDSTNTYAEQQIIEGRINEPFCIVARCQSAGKGQNANSWESEAGKNLTFSVVCFPDFLSAEKQFYLNKAVALSVYELVSGLPQKNVSIKWPNDIYIEDKKVAGTLIQSAVQSGVMKYSIIGIGLNVNQKNFPDYLPNPTSVFQHTKNETDIDQVLENYLDIFEKYYELLKNGRINEIDSRYHEALYRFGQRSTFEYEGKKIHASICGVNEYGWLQLLTDDGKMLSGDMNKVKIIL